MGGMSDSVIPAAVEGGPLGWICTLSFGSYKHAAHGQTKTEAESGAADWLEWKGVEFQRLRGHS